MAKTLHQDIEQRIIKLPGAYIHKNGKITGEIKEGWVVLRQDLINEIEQAFLAAVERAKPANWKAADRDRPSEKGLKSGFNLGVHHYHNALVKEITGE